MQRRNFLHSAAAAAAAPLSAAAATVESLADGQPTIDVNTYLDRWPFRRLPLDEAPALAAKLREKGISQAWAGSFEALLHRDLDAVNTRLVGACRSLKESPLKPIGAINPKLPDWRKSLDRCHREHRMTGIRLHPNYHGYTLDDPEFLKLLAEAHRRKLFVQIAVRMEDGRTQHPAVQVADVDPNPLLQALPKHRGIRVQLLNALRSARENLLITRLAGLGVQFDIAMLEGAAGIETLLERNVPVSALAFGSYAPYFPVESSLLKLKESKLATSESVAIRCHNVENMLIQA